LNRSIASRPVAASPANVISGWLSIIAANPSRRTGWSSTTRIRIVCGSFVMCPNSQSACVPACSHHVGSFPSLPASHHLFDPDRLPDAPRRHFELYAALFFAGCSSLLCPGIRFEIRLPLKQSTATPKEASYRSFFDVSQICGN